MSILSRAHLSDATLVRQAFEHTARESGLTAEHLADLAEIDARQIYRAEAFESLLDFCVRGLRLTRDEAKLRIRIARKCREFPALLEAIAEGRLRMSAVDLLATRLTPANAEELIAATAHKPIEQLREILAARFPRADLPERIEALASPTPFVQEMSSEGGSNPLREPGNEVPALELSSPVPVPAAIARPRVEPLSAERFGLQCTIGRGTWEKLNYVRSLLGRGVANGDLAGVLDRALDALARQLERRKYGLTDRPRARARHASANPRHVPSEVKRAVVTRDGGQCTFVSDTGRRCEARERLEFDHVEPVARGGTATTANLRLRCRAHNQLEAERTYGAEFMRHRRIAAREAAVARTKAREARERAEADSRARRQAADEVIPWLRSLGLRKEEARAAAAACEAIPGAPLEDRVRLALRSFARPRTAQAVAVPKSPLLPAHPSAAEMVAAASGHRLGSAVLPTPGEPRCQR